MNKNNFFVKFAHYYKLGFTRVKKNVELIIDCLIMYIVHTGEFILAILLTPILIVFFLLLPVLEIIPALTTEYLDAEAAKNYAECNGIPDMGAGYYLKKKLREKAAAEYRRDREEFMRRQMNSMQKEVYRK
jgi:hypothetical protein